MSCTCDCWLLKYLLNFNLCLGEIYLFPSAELKALCQNGKCQVCAKICNSSAVSPSGQGLGVLHPTGSPIAPHTFHELQMETPNSWSYIKAMWPRNASLSASLPWFLVMRV